MPPLLPAPPQELISSNRSTSHNSLRNRKSGAHSLGRAEWVQFVTFDCFPRGKPGSSRDPAWLPVSRGSWEERIEDYLRESSGEEPVEPAEDVERFLQWLADSSWHHSAAQRAVAAQDDWPSAELSALCQRLAHARFQQRWRSSLTDLPRLSPRSRLLATLNPIHVWATWAGPRREGETETSASEVLFFPVGDEVQTVRLGIDAANMLRRLERRGRTVRQLVRSAPDLTPDEGLELLRELCRAGAIAIG